MLWECDHWQHERDIMLSTKTIISQVLAYSRSLSTLQSVKPAAASNRTLVLSDSEKKNFFAEFPGVISTICERNKISEVPEIENWIKKLFYYYSNGGHKSRGLMIASAYKNMVTPENYDETTLKEAFILGWCVELLQTGLLLTDDIIDNSSTRRGLVCWHQLRDVGYGAAINDANFFFSALFDYLKGRFGNKPYYSRVLDKFHKSIGDFALSTKLETLTQRNYNQFTTQRYNQVSSIKMAYYTFGLSLDITSMLVANKPETNIVHDSADIIRDMGILIMMQNDYTDCYEDETVTGKAGNDIQEGKCTWLAVEALRRCSDEQRIQFEKHYGSNNPSNVQQIKEIYQRLDIHDLCRKHIRTLYEDIVQRIHALPAGSSPKAIHSVLDIMYHYPNVKNTLI